jgi:hypothetical protein
VRLAALPLAADAVAADLPPDLHLPHHRSPAAGVRRPSPTEPRSPAADNLIPGLCLTEYDRCRP